MRTTVTLDDQLIESLRKSTGIENTSALLKQALIEMRQRRAALDLIALGGSDPSAKAAPRRRYT
jgi:hypothetical protein